MILVKLPSLLPNCLCLLTLLALSVIIYLRSVVKVTCLGALRFHGLVLTPLVAMLRIVHRIVVHDVTWHPGALDMSKG